MRPRLARPPLDGDSPRDYPMFILAEYLPSVGRTASSCTNDLSRGAKSRCRAQQFADRAQQAQLHRRGTSLTSRRSPPAPAPLRQRPQPTLIVLKGLCVIARILFRRGRQASRADDRDRTAEAAERRDAIACIADQRDAPARPARHPDLVDPIEVEVVVAGTFQPSECDLRWGRQRADRRAAACRLLGRLRSLGWPTTMILVQPLVCRLDRQPAALRHCISGIDREIEQRAFQLGRVDLGQPQAAGANHLHLDLRAHSAADEREVAFRSVSVASDAAPPSAHSAADEPMVCFGSTRRSLKGPRWLRTAGQLCGGGDP